MKSHYRRLWLLSALTSLISTAASAAPHSDTSQTWPLQSLSWIGETRIPNDAKLDQVVVGGLSGIDYDAKHHRWLMISDDRAEHGPARAYLGTMALTTTSISPMHLTTMIALRQADGSQYPNATQFTHQGDVPDFESVRFTPDGQHIRYTSEGDRALKLNPFIRDAKLDGQYVQQLPTPVQMQFGQQPHHGFYDNLAFEGSSFTPDGQHYFVAMEAPVQQDGPVPNATHGAMARLTEYNRHNQAIAQYVYPVDAWPSRPGKGKHADNGVSEMLALDEHHLLFLERAGIQDASGAYHDSIRIYQVATQGATNVLHRDSLKTQAYQPMKKQLLLDLAELKLPLLDNIEGMTFGPTLANGQRSLVLISDNNFSRHEVTQLLAFAINPAH